ncbi:hypothetical protein OAU50_02165 [Planctomycetota bacterium]|nr:hypothetical protein [Planctomycetota bacterium]
MNKPANLEQLAAALKPYAEHAAAEVRDVAKEASKVLLEAVAQYVKGDLEAWQVERIAKSCYRANRSAAARVADRFQLQSFPAILKAAVQFVAGLVGGPLSIANLNLD